MKFAPKAGAAPNHTFENAWPRAGVYTIPGKLHPFQNPVRVEFETTGTCAGLRLVELERILSRLPVESRYLEEVFDFDARVRTNFNTAVGWDTPGAEHEPPRCVPRTNAGRVVEYLKLHFDIVADGVAILGNEPVLPYYAYMSEREANKAKADWGEEETIAHLASRIGEGLIDANLCDAVTYEKTGDDSFSVYHERKSHEANALRIELRAGGKIWLAVTLGLKIYTSLREIAYGPSRGLLFCRDGTRRATPTMQFLMVYGLAVDAPETAHGVRVALSAGFEVCDVLLSHTVAHARSAVRDLRLPPAAPRAYQDASGNERFILDRGPISEGNNFRAAVTPPPEPAWFEQPVDNVELLAGERYGAMVRRGFSVATAMQPDAFRDGLVKRAESYLNAWMGRVIGHDPMGFSHRAGSHEHMESLAELGVDQGLADLAGSLQTFPAYREKCLRVRSELRKRAEVATRLLFPGWAPAPASKAGDRAAGSETFRGSMPFSPLLAKQVKYAREHTQDAAATEAIDGNDSTLPVMAVIDQEQLCNVIRSLAESVTMLQSALETQ